VVEEGSVKDVFDEPLHPYTHGLLECIPVGFKRKTEVDYIPGTLPSPINPPVGCRFHPRCKYATEKCVKEEPQLIEVGKNHTVACHRAKEIDISSYARKIWGILMARTKSV
jgi:oligopeptide/dipeptide ABC transporter ATP-binding protein